MVETVVVVVVMMTLVSDPVLGGRRRGRPSGCHSDDVGGVDPIDVSLRDDVALLVVLVRHGKRADRESGCNDCGTHIEKMSWLKVYLNACFLWWIADPVTIGKDCDGN